jgi:hypothetical protein
MDRYIIGQRLGEGSFGTVHLAVHKMTGGKVSAERMQSLCWRRCRRVLLCLLR